MNDVTAIRSALVLGVPFLVVPLLLAGCDRGDASATPTTSSSGAGSGAIITIGTSFDGVSGPGYSDHPDMGGAVGPSHIVDFVGLSFTVRNKSTGAVVESMSQNQFWTNAGVTPGTLLDPRIVYDPLAQRWYAVNAGPDAFLAISASEDPTGSWMGVPITTAVTGDLLVKVAFDATGVYTCFYGGNTNSNCYAIPKVDLLWGSTLAAPTLARMASFINMAFEMVPAIDLNASKAVTAPEALLTRQGGQHGANLAMVLILQKVTWSGNGCLALNGSCTASISAAQNIATNFTYTSPVTAVQPGSAQLIRGAEDHRFFDVFASGGSIFGAHGTEINGRIGFEWFEVRISDGAVLQQAELSDPNADLIFASVAVDSNGSLGIGYTKTSANEYPSIYLTGRLSTDPINTLRSPVLATAGTAGYACNLHNPTGWGTYSSTVRDPANPLTLWTFQEYANSSNNCQWATRWVSFSL